MLYSNKPLNREINYTMTNHTESLMAKHAALEEKIDMENARPHPDDIRIAELKRQKLKLKEEIILSDVS